MRWWYAAARLLSSLGAIVLIGAVRVVAVGPGRPRRAPRAASGGAHRLVLVGRRFGGRVRSVRRRGRGGHARRCRLTVGVGRHRHHAHAVACCSSASPSPSCSAHCSHSAAHRAAGWWRATGFTAALLTLYTFPAGGRANALEPSALWIAVDLAHLAAITVWIGGLVAVAFAGRAVLETGEGEQLAKRFSAAATITVPVIVATGVAQTLKLSSGIDELTDTDWGRLLLVKVTVVVTLLAIAGVSRSAVAP